MKIHFIAIGGSAMHNLAIALHKKGYEVSGSDDEIFEPSRSRLAKYGLLPSTIGWNPDLITPDLDAVILGMHAREDNPQLLRAKELGLKIYSYPEYLYEQSKDKTRIVVGGSHGKTTITSMILHVMKHCGIDTDYMVGAQLEGFEVMVKLSHTAKYMVIEGDEYLTSPIDRRPKFHLYQPNIAIISGIAWDHINVFPTFDNYVEQFRIFANMIPQNGALVYCAEDPNCVSVAEGASVQHKFPYSIPAYNIQDGTTYLQTPTGSIPLMVFGRHNLMNINGARLVCNQIGISDEQFYEAIQSFAGASKRLELVKKTADSALFKDFAHSPSKLKATIEAVKEQFPNRELTACMELHTFSSLNARFLQEYKGVMNKADVRVVYYNEHTLAHKKLPPITPEMIKQAFDVEQLHVFTDSALMVEFLKQQNPHNRTFLMMSSGNFDGIDFAALADELIGDK